MTLAVLTTASLAATASFLLVRAVRSSVPSPSSATRRACLQPAAFLQPGDLPGFTQIVNNSQQGPPIPGGEPAVVKLLSEGYVGGRLVGYLANVAITGPDRSTEDAQARQMGYTPGSIPLVPLSGPIVRDSPGVLEVYEILSVYQNATEANRWAQALDQSIEFGGSVVPLTGVPRGDGFFLPAPSSGRFPPYESEYQLVDVLHSSVLHIGVQGGSALHTSDISRIASTAMHELGKMCSL